MPKPPFDPEATQWRYTRKNPPAGRMMADELDGHRFAWHQRTERLLGKVTQYRATCTCKDWAHDEWRPTRAMARRDFLRHVAAAERQLTLHIH